MKEALIPKPTKSDSIHPLLHIRFTLSCCLFFFSLFVLVTGNNSQKPIKGVLGVVIVFVLIIWLGVMEGSQNALVGVRSIYTRDSTLSSHKIASRTAAIVFQNNNLDRFIIGRQLLVVMTVFTINFIGTIHTGCTTAFDLPSILSRIFCEYGLALIIVTVLLGQLTAQMISTKSMIDFIDLRVTLLTVVVALAVEWTGIVHAVYLIQATFLWVSGKVGIREALGWGRGICSRIWFVVRLVLSIAALLLSLAVVCDTIVTGHTTVWNNLPPIASIVLFFCLMALVAILEGLQIALIALRGCDLTAVVHDSSWTFANVRLVTRDEQLSSFLVGRQVCVTVCMFVIARITTVDTNNSPDSTLGLGSTFQKIVNTNLLSAFVTTILGSLVFRVIASASPIGFLSNPFANILIRLCLFLDLLGVMHFAKILAALISRIFRFQNDSSFVQSVSVSEYSES